VALPFLFVILRRAIELVGLRRKSTFDKDVETLVLRHQLEVLHRKGHRARFTWADRAWLALASQFLPRRRWTAFLVTPATLLEWQRRVVRRRWAYPNRPGRPSLDPETIELVCRMVRENPRWGYLRIVGELRKLEVPVLATSVRGILRRHGMGPAPQRSGPMWTEFIRSQATTMLSTDFFHVDTVLGQRLYGLFVIELESRVMHFLGVTANPNGSWMAQIARNLVFDLHQAQLDIRFLVRDRDTKFTAAFDQVLLTEGIRTIRTPVRAPRANAYAERWIETRRAECLDHLLIVSSGQLERVLRHCVGHYDRARPHRGLELAVPRPRASDTGTGPIKRRDVLGGLCEYARAA